jgi:hypothetical protein
VIEGEICGELRDVSGLPTVDEEEILDVEISPPLEEVSGIVVDDETLVVPPLGSRDNVDEEGSTEVLLLVGDVDTPLEVDDNVEEEVGLEGGGCFEAILDEEVPVEEAEVDVTVQC